MVTSHTQLFAGMTIDDYLHAARTAWRTRIIRTKTVADLDLIAATLPQAAAVKACRLRRQEARFVVSESETAVVVELIVPLEGDPRLLNVRCYEQASDH